MGDMDYLCGVFGLPRWSLSVGCCDLCRCNATGLNTYTNFHENAPWVATCWTVRTWRAWLGRSKHLVFGLPGVSVLSVTLDYMRLKYLGSDQQMFGSVFVLLVYDVLPGTPQANLDECWEFIKAFYKKNKTAYQYQYLNKLTMFVRKSGYTKLRGKAGEIKDLGPALLALWTAKMDETNNIHVVIRIMLKCNVQMVGNPQ